MTTEFHGHDAMDLRFIAKTYLISQHDSKTLLELANKIESTMNTTFNTRGPRPGSFNALVQELNPGETVSKVREVDPTITVARLPDEMPEIRQQVRNSVAPAVARAKQITGGTYSVEVGDVIMPTGAMYAVAVVKRID